jgi:hypothetical protein
MKRLVALVLALTLTGASAVVAGVCGNAGMRRSHCCCHPDATGDSLASPCQCRIAPHPEERRDSLPPSVSAPDRAAHGALAPLAPVALAHVSSTFLAPGLGTSSPPVSPPSYLTARNFRC